MAPGNEERVVTCSIPARDPDAPREPTRPHWRLTGRYGHDQRRTTDRMGAAIPDHVSGHAATPAREDGGDAGADDPLRDQERPGAAAAGALGARAAAAARPRPAPGRPR